MRIALVNPYSFDVAGGVGTHVLGLATWLHDAGHEPLVIGPGRHAVETPFPVMVLGPAVGVPFNGSTARLALGPRQAARARALVGDADVVHVHEPLTPGMAFAVARGARRLVVTHHAHFLVPAGLRALLRRRSSALPVRESIAVSAAAADTAHQATGSRPDIIPNAISLPTPSPKPDWATVLFVGRASDPRKGHTLFRVLAERLRGEARFVELADGRASAAAVAQAMDEATVLVAPNLGGESFGIVLVEALAHGCAIVASDLPAFRATVGAQAPVEWFAPGDADEAERALRRRLAVPPAPDVARRAAEAYSLDVIGPRVLERYARASGR